MASNGAPMFAQPLATWEREGLKAALLRAGQPTDDVEDESTLFWRFERDDVPVGFAGLEVHGQDALLRSIVTLPPLRQSGVGAAMVAKIEVEARARGAQAVYLVTQGDDAFFTKIGYARCEREQVPPAIATTPLFARLEASATAMVKQI